MKTRGHGTLALLAVSVLFAGSIANAQQTVYKWVDEDGVVHFGDSPPDGVKAEQLTTSAAPAPPPPSATTAAQPRTTSSQQAAKPAAEKPAAPAQVNISEMSLAELDARCDQAREARIAPLREAEIERCKASPRNDPAFCERTNADFGEGGRNVNGSIRPRMFDDLPECVEALQERNRRPR